MIQQTAQYTILRLTIIQSAAFHLSLFPVSSYPHRFSGIAEIGESIWTYEPNFPLSIVAAALYLIPLVVQGYQTFIKYRSYYFWVVFFGALLEVGGYAARAVSIKHLDQIVRTPPMEVETQS